MQSSKFRSDNYSHETISENVIKSGTGYLRCTELRRNMNMFVGYEHTKCTVRNHFYHVKRDR